MKDPSPLRRELLRAARDEAPPASSTERALQLVDTAPAERATVHWLVWALPAAAAVIVGVVLLAVLRPQAETDATVASPEPEPSATSSAPPTPAATSTLRLATPDPAATSSTATPPPSAPSGRIAVRPTPGAAPGAKPQPAPPRPAGGAGSCGCSADDLMCHIRCSQKGKKKKQ